MKPLKIGDYVTSSNHGHTGRVYGFEDRNSITAAWFDTQNIQPTEDQKNGIWVKILVHQGGAVVVPYDTIKRVRKFKFEHFDIHGVFADEVHS